MKNGICVIAVYFGKLPNCFPLWLKSCEKNPDIDFFVMTDQTGDNLPSNVRFVDMTLAETKARAEKLLGFPVFLEKPYKLCDYKPLYGLLFSDYVGEYAFWGHCDLDLVFGDLSCYFEKYNLESYDRFLPLGHLSFYRNTEEVGNRYKCEGSYYPYTKVFTTDEIAVFDEIRGMTSVYIKNGFPIFTGLVYADISMIYKRFRVTESNRLGEIQKNYDNQIFLWENGKVFREYFEGGTLKRDEFMYIHFKKRPNFPVDFDPSSCSSFYITMNGFVPKTGETSLETVKKYNPFPGKIKEWYYDKKYQTTYRINEYLIAIKRRLKRRK